MFYKGLMEVTSLWSCGLWTVSCSLQRAYGGISKGIQKFNKTYKISSVYVPLIKEILLSLKKVFRRFDKRLSKVQTIL